MFENDSKSLILFSKNLKRNEKKSSIFPVKSKCLFWFRRNTLTEKIYVKHFGDFQTLLPMVGQQQKWFFVFLR